MAGRREILSGRQVCRRGLWLVLYRYLSCPGIGDGRSTAPPRSSGYEEYRPDALILREYRDQGIAPGCRMCLTNSSGTEHPKLREGIPGNGFPHYDSWDGEGDRAPVA